MVTVLSLFKFLIVGILLPYLLGIRAANKIQKELYAPMQSILFGYVILWAFLQIILIPMIYARISFQQFFIIAGVSVLLVCACEIILQRKQIFADLTGIFSRIKENGVLRNVLFLLIIIQAVYVGLAYLSNDDDAYFVAEAQTALDTNTLMEYDPYTGDYMSEFPSRYVLSPFPLFIAFMSKAVGVKAAVMAHTLLPVILVLLVYVVYFMWAQELFPEEKNKQTYFLLFAVLILSFSTFTTHARGMMMFTRIWQGKAVLSVLLLPLLLLFGIRMIRRDLSKGEIALLVVTELACCLSSSMGIMLGAIELGVCGIISLIHSKKMKRIGTTLLACAPNILYAVIYLIIR